MPILGKPYLSITFSAEMTERPEKFDGDPSSVIPASALGNVISLTNDLMQITWDYAWWNIDDDRFDELRKLEATGLIDRRDVELVVVSFNKGSVEAIFDWSFAFLGAASFWQTLPSNIAVEASWDLAKYSFQSLWQLIRRKEAQSQQPNPLLNELLPFFEHYSNEAYRVLSRGISMRSEVRYKDNQSEFSILIDKGAQEIIFEANEVEIDYATRLIGAVVGIDYSEGSVDIRWEQFPEQTIWCDIGNLETYEVEKLLTLRPKDIPKRMGFDVEVGWRKGATKKFPPDSIRIIQIVPDVELKNLKYIDRKGYRSTPIHEINVELNEIELKFLKWLSWADDAWTSPNFSGIVGYLAKRNDVLGKRLERQEIENLVKYFVHLGILLRTRDSKRRNPAHQALRLNRNHHLVVKYLQS
jgi:hypothetical protein